MKFLHLRRKDKRTGRPLSTGGITVAYVLDKDTHRLSFTLCRCRRNEHYCRKLGRTISGGRYEANQGTIIPMQEDVHPVASLMDELRGLGYLNKKFQVR